MPNFKSKLTHRATMSPDDPARKRHGQRQGNPPKPVQRPQLFAELHDSDALIWRLAWLRSGVDGKVNEGPDSDWFNLKLYAVGKAPYKANYWISWNARDRRLKKWLDTSALAAINPKLMQMLTSTLTYMWSNSAFDAESSVLHVARWDGASIVVTEDVMHDALTGAIKSPIFTEADRPRLKTLAALLIAERGLRGWTTVPDELTGGFRVVAK